MPNKLKISLIVGIGQKNEIGHKNELLWRIREDLQNFKRITMGHHILMGRKTYDSIGRPLPGRNNMILTRQESFQAEGCEVYTDLEAAFRKAEKAGETELFVIGGASLYEMTLEQANRIYLTRFHGTKSEADTFFPEIKAEEWESIEKTDFPQKDEKSVAWSFEILERKS